MKHGGFHLPLVATWERVCAELRSKKIHGADAFLRLPAKDRSDFFLKLARIALVPAGSENATQALLGCFSSHPDVTCFALLALRARVRKLNRRSPDYWQSFVGRADPKMTRAQSKGKSDAIAAQRRFVLNTRERGIKV
jgi:hypothetical protein